MILMVAKLKNWLVTIDYQKIFSISSSRNTVTNVFLTSCNVSGVMIAHSHCVPKFTSYLRWPSVLENEQYILMDYMYQSIGMDMFRKQKCFLALSLVRHNFHYHGDIAGPRELKLPIWIKNAVDRKKPEFLWPITQQFLGR